MSRRDSRVSLGSRQNDALVEFESFKKKFLLANKHITKLNSTLSVRIEELNAQISTLYVENLRLRASEIALTAQLKREKEKSSQVIAEAEAAAQSLTKHLNYLRQTMNIVHLPPPPSKEITPTHTPPRPRNTNAEPRDEVLRVARPPNVPGIDEEDEPPTDDNADVPRIRSGGRSKAPAPHLPLPPVASVSVTRKKHGSSVRRRESGLLIEGVRPGSPTVGSPVQKQVEVDDDGMEEDVIDEEGFKPIQGTSKRRQRGGEEVKEMDEDAEDHRPTRRKQREEKDAADKKERKRKSKDADIEDAQVDGEPPSEIEQTKEKKVKSKTKARLMDVTNSPRGSIGLTLRPEDAMCSTANATGASHSTAASKSRSFLAPRPPSTISSSSSSQAASSSSSHQQPQLPVESSSKANSSCFLQTPRTSSSPPPEEPDAELPDEGLKFFDDDVGTEAVGGRERRSRKSVNYAEPKLNTKMRKPDPPSGTAKGSKKRTSTASASSIATLVHPPAPLLDGHEGTIKGKRKRGSDGSEPPPEEPALGNPSPWIQASFVVRTRKLKSPEIEALENNDEEDDDDYKEESDGDQADGEFAVRRYKTKGGSGGSLDNVPDGWANVDQSRRRSHSSAAGKVVNNGSTGRLKRRTGGSEAGAGFLTDWEERRHTMAV